MGKADGGVVHRLFARTLRASQVEYMGKADGGVAHRLFARTLRASQVVYMTAGCERYAAGAGPNRLHVVHAGVPVLRRHRGRAECDAVGRFGLTAMGRRLL